MTKKDIQEHSGELILDQVGTTFCYYSGSSLQGNCEYQDKNYYITSAPSSATLTLDNRENNRFMGLVVYPGPETQGLLPANMCV
jgi:hypothetical protein